MVETKAIYSMHLFSFPPPPLSLSLSLSLSLCGAVLYTCTPLTIIISESFIVWGHKIYCHISLSVDNSSHFLPNFGSFYSQHATFINTIIWVIFFVYIFVSESELVNRNNRCYWCNSHISKPGVDVFTHNMNWVSSSYQKRVVNPMWQHY